MKHIIIISTLILLRTATAAEFEPKIQFAPKKILTGQVSLAKIEAEGAVGLTLKVENDSVPLFECPAKKDKGKKQCAFVAVPVDREPGTLTLTIAWSENGAAPGTAPHEKKITLKVGEGKFPVMKLKVDPGLANPSLEDQKRIAAEKEETTKVFASGSPSPLWDEKFIRPAKGSVTSRFGGRRIFNGEVKSIHQGVDLRAATGAEIRSANAGEVKLAQPMFFAGNQVILDHGAGVFTSYSHLSEIKVTPGQKVKKGELLGLAGATGRVTGPHLHWGMRVNGFSVDAEQMRTVFNKMWK